MISSKKIFRWYKEVLSGFPEEETQRQLTEHDLIDKATGQIISVPILKQENFGEEMVIDDKNIGSEEYTIISNPKTKKIAVMVMSRKVEFIKQALDKIPSKIRRGVKTIAKDLAPGYDWIARMYFSFADRIADKFHVLTLAFEALQAIRIRYRQEVMTREREAKENKKKFTQQRFSNGETEKELLARSHGLLYKRPDQWTFPQKERAGILFALYPEIEKSYHIILRFRYFYQTKEYCKATEDLQRWFVKAKESESSEIQNFAHMVDTHRGDILNYFIHHKTNAFAESLNSHIQRFFINNYGIRNRDFFHFRIKTYFS